MGKISPSSTFADSLHFHLLYTVYVCHSFGLIILGKRSCFGENFLLIFCRSSSALTNGKTYPQIVFLCLPIQNQFDSSGSYPSQLRGLNLADNNNTTSSSSEMPQTKGQAGLQVPQVP